MLLPLNPLGEGLHVIACMHRDCRLSDDRSRIHIGLDVMNGEKPAESRDRSRFIS